MLDFRTETFLTVCHTMNFTEAAKILHLTQPAVSGHIRYLEERYQTPLFIRDKKKLRLTPAGELLKKTLESIHHDERLLCQKMKECQEGKKTITFGLTRTIGQYTIVPKLAAYIKAHQELNIHIRSHNTETLLHELDEGTIDFAIVEGYFNPEGYETRVFKHESFVCVCNSHHTFHHQVHSLKDLTDQTLLIREPGSGTRAIFTKQLSLHNLSIDSFARIIEIETMETIVKLLTYDCGISFLYTSAIMDELKQGSLKIIPLHDFNISHDFTFLWHKHSAFSKEYEDIYNELKTS